MEPFSALLMGGSSLLGSLFSSQTSQENTAANIAMQQGAQKETEAFNASEAQKNRDYQTSMSNSAYQRAKTDMEAAGLNPMMMTGGSMNASTPSGATASVGTPNMALSNKQSPLAGIGQAMNAAFEGMVKTKLMEKTTEDIANTHQDTLNQQVREDLLRQEYSTRQPEARKAMIRMGYPDWLANALTYGGDISEGVSKAGNALWDVLPTKKLLQAVTGGDAKSVSTASRSRASDVRSAIDAGTASPEITREIEKGIEPTASNTALRKFREAGNSGLAWPKQLERFMREGKDLGGRAKGTGGSYD